MGFIGSMGFIGFIGFIGSIVSRSFDVRFGWVPNLVRDPHPLVEATHETDKWTRATAIQP
jgi:hypothetical protein